MLNAVLLGVKWHAKHTTIIMAKCKNQNVKFVQNTLKCEITFRREKTR